MLIIPKRHGGTQAASLGLTLLIMTAMLQAADKPEIFSLNGQGDNRDAVDTTQQSVDGEFIHGRGDSVHQDSGVALWTFTNQGQKKVELGARRAYDSYVFFISQSF